MCYQARAILLQLHREIWKYQFIEISSITQNQILFLTFTLREMCPYSELFWSGFSHIRTEYGPE